MDDLGTIRDIAVDALTSPYGWVLLAVAAAIIAWAAWPRRGRDTPKSGESE